MVTSTTDLRSRRELAPVGARQSAVAEGQKAALVARLVLVLAALVAVTPSPLSRLWGAAELELGRQAVHIGLFLAWFGLAFFGYLRRLAASGGALLVDVVMLTAVLAVAGAAENPFTLLYFVPITLATLVSQAFTWRVAATAVVGFVVLLFISTGPGSPHAEHAHYQSHVRGMAVALAASGLLVTIFVHRLARVVEEGRTEIQRLRRARERDRVATSLGAVAAGAAHELGTPLGTVQLLVADLPHMTAGEQLEAVSEVNRQIERMKEVLHRLDSTELSAEIVREVEPWNVQELAEELEREHGAKIAVVARTEAKVRQPRSVIEQIARELVNNARRVHDEGLVEVEFWVSSAAFGLAVRDRGPGLSEEEAEAAIEPFVSTTGGRGLGLFLAHVHARQLGGALLVLARAGGGTSVELHLPASPPAPFDREAQVA